MLLGEDAVETWIGVVEVAKTQSAAEVGGKGLKSAVAELRETELQWALLRPERDDGKTTLIRVCPGIKPRHWLAFDQHLSITESYRPSDDDGLPSSEKLDKLNQAEDQLLATLGERAVFHGREVAAGACIWHFHCDAGAEQVFRDWLGKYLPKAALERSADPAWANPEWRAG